MGKRKINRDKMERGTKTSGKGERSKQKLRGGGLGEPTITWNTVCGTIGGKSKWIGVPPHATLGQQKAGQSTQGASASASEGFAEWWGDLR